MATDRGSYGTPPYEYLVRDTCIGCHMATDGTTWKNGLNAPIVFNTLAPQYGASYNGGPNQGLAGGNFYWVSQGDDTKGHNVRGIGNDTDENLSTAPGGDITGSMAFCDVCHATGAPGGPDMDCGDCHDRISSCRSCHIIYTGHHIDDSGPFVGGPWSTNTAFRFLYGRPHQNRKVSGIEDNDWEYTASSSDHNEINGISIYCKGCHTIFHRDVGSSSPWLRHPTTNVIPNSGEYSAYTTYDPLVPVERPIADLQSWSGPSSQVRPGIDMVSCTSCHRAHGSPYPDLLRWNYSEMLASDSSKSGGCFRCHTQKNQTP